MDQLFSQEKLKKMFLHYLEVHLPLKWDSFMRFRYKHLGDSYCTIRTMRKENAYYMEMCKKYNYNYIMIDDYYIEIDS